jgi:tetratricopeptide (TPR) repeat protein
MEHRNNSEPGTETLSAEDSLASFRLPPAPPTETGIVKAWEEPAVIPTYMPAKPDPNPLFLEKRVYQGSSGRVYPLPVIDRVDIEPQNHSWKAVHLENEFLRFMVLPEIGGRIHVGYDKIGHYDFFYRQNVIKPALVGLAGPWISGGVEFNWPQHHRPATFMPVEVFIERDADGSITVWCSDHDPMSRMKGMHGLCLRPGKAYLEVKVRLYNRTTDTQTFLWWANVATRVHEKYQSFLPKDVSFVADHAKRAVTEFPLSQGTYYDVDYGKRATCGVPEQEKPAHYVPDGSYPANDLSWYANIPVPTSYMAVGSKGDFAGGYDHALHSGVVYVANHHVAPGKKQWTWGNHEFGYAWDRSLTDSDGPYIELMAGAYTDNQPDFSFLAPGETKTFSQFWYPIRKIGVPDFANTNAALRVERHEDRVRIHLMVTRVIAGSAIRLKSNGQEIAAHLEDLKPESPVSIEFVVPASVQDLEVVLESAGETVLSYAQAEITPVDRPEVATEPPLPEEVGSNDELYLIGMHLEQYRHATRSPEPYWREAIRRDPQDSRANCALGRWHLRRGELALAERHLRTSIGRLTERNPNPYDGEPHYNLGLALLLQQRLEEAYEAFYKSTWNAAWRGPAYHRLAEIDCANRAWTRALDHIQRSLRADTDNLNARNLQTIVLSRLGREDESALMLQATRALDPLDIWSRYLESGEAPQDGQQTLDLSFDLLRAGLLDEAFLVLCAPHADANDGSRAMLAYALGLVSARLGREVESSVAYRRAAEAEPTYVFPVRLDEMVLLEEAIRVNPQDARARYYLGNFLYDRRRHDEAIESWESAAALDPKFPTTWRNLGIGYYNIRHDEQRSRLAFEQARTLSPRDARIVYEQTQLLKRTGEPPQSRLASLESVRDLVETRDDLTVELATLFNQLGRPEDALKLLLARRFQPWEGGEGLVLAQYVRAHRTLGQAALENGQATIAIDHFKAALTPPQSLSEAWHLLASRSSIDYWLGAAYDALGKNDEAAEWWNRAASREGDFQQMQIHAISETTFWRALALQKLGQSEKAAALFKQMYDYALQLEQETPKIDYFATSLPAMLLFDEDLKRRQDLLARFLQAQALVGMCEPKRALTLLRKVQELDENHGGAADLVARLTESPGKLNSGRELKRGGPTSDSSQVSSPEAGAVRPLGANEAYGCRLAVKEH